MSTLLTSHPRGDRPDAGEKRRIAERFGARAGHYDQVTPIQTAMRNRLLAEALERLAGRSIARILELGCGTGPLTRQLRDAFPGAQITALDIAGGMIAEARKKIPDAIWIVADAEDYCRIADGPFDLIVSNATAQWFHYPHRTMARYRTLLARNGLMAWTTFGENTLGELQASFLAAYQALGLPPRRHTLPMLPPSYWKIHFPEAEFAETAYAVNYPDVRTFLRAVKNAGASYTRFDAKPLARGVLTAMSEFYQKNFPATEGSGIRASYHGVFLYQS
jgi:malonyl-CoA O-methyltransferase